MPRNSQGLYTPPLPPVLPGELIESAWANTTIDDIASAITDSLPRNGSAPMVGPLILRNAPPTQPREAISKQYLEQFLAYATGMPVGAVFAFASAATPAGYLLCNGQAVSRTTYAALFAAIGTTFGSGDGSTTFNVPDMRDWFVRGRGDSRQLGSTQTGAIQLHTHVVQDPGHNHGASQAAHAHATVAHSHGVTDPGHHHSYNTLGGTGVVGFGAGGGFANPADTSDNGTGISIQNAAPNTDSQQPAVAVAGNTTGVAIGSTGEGETRPQNIALDYYIKAIDDATQVTALTGITSSNDNMISIDSTNPVVPELVIHANAPFGIPQLDANGKVLLSQVPISATILLGFYDASTGLNPSQAHPTTDYTNGEFYIVSVAGNIQVRDPATGVESMTAVATGGTLLYLEGQTQPDGWYYAVPVASDSAANISFLPGGTISATNVQQAIEELDLETQVGLSAKAPLSAGTAAGTSFAPTGDIAATNVQDAIVEVKNETASLSNALPVMDGAASAGAGTAASRDDHRHPTDTSRAPVSAMTAVGTSFTPSGSILATNVQAAIEEVGKGPAFRATNNGGATQNTTALVVVSTEQFDTNSNYDPVQSRFTPTVPGYYNIIGTLSGDALNAGAWVFPKIYKNGAAYSEGSSAGITAGAQNVNYYSTLVSCLVYLNGTTDYVELWATIIGTPSVISATFSGSLARGA